jgi:hypothetical protein
MRVILLSSRVSCSFVTKCTSTTWRESCSFEAENYADGGRASPDGVVKSNRDSGTERDTMCVAVKGAPQTTEW